MEKKWCKKGCGELIIKEKIAVNKRIKRWNKDLIVGTEKCKNCEKYRMFAVAKRKKYYIKKLEEKNIEEGFYNNVVYTMYYKKGYYGFVISKKRDKKEKNVRIYGFARKGILVDLAWGSINVRKKKYIMQLILLLEDVNDRGFTLGGKYKKYWWDPQNVRKRNRIKKKE